MKIKMSVLTCIVIYHLFCISSLFAKATKIPEWVQNYRKVYPDSEYLVQRGSGDSAEKARTDAAAALSRYFQTCVNANLSTTMSSVSSDELIEETTVIVDDVNVQSQVNFFGLEYTEPYYLKSEKKWYCVVYLNREDAWLQYKPQIDLSRNTFNSLYKNLNDENDDFSKLEMCKKALNAGNELLEKLEYGRIINPEKETAYELDRENISWIPVIFEESKGRCRVYIQVDEDYNRIISTAVSTALTENGFLVEKNKEDGLYIAKIEIENNESGNNPISISPGINIKIINENGKTVFSYETMANEKTVAYSLENAKKKAYPKTAKIIQEALAERLSSFY